MPQITRTKGFTCAPIAELKSARDCFVLLGFVSLLFLTTQLPSSGLKLAHAKTGYHVSAAFDNVGDLKVGAPVTMAGVDLGRGGERAH